MRLSSHVLVTFGASLVASAYAGLEDVKYSTKLTVNNFDSAIAGKNSLVAFFAPWCGHCKSLAPTWEQLAKDFQDEESVLIGHLDADNADNRPTAQRYGVQGFPTIKFFSADGSAPQDYQSARTEAAFLEFINEHVGTRRAVGGSLNEMAGRLPSFDELVSNFLDANSDARNAIIKKAKETAAKLKISAEVSAATYYLKVMDKLTTAAEWATKEQARLQKLASKRGTMAGKQIEDLQIRQNILAAFSAAREGAASLAGEAGAEASAGMKKEL